MLNKITLFLLLFTVWLISLYFSNILTIAYIIYGFFAALITTIFVFNLSIFLSTTEFLFLQFEFYKYILGKINDNLINVFKICIQFLKPDSHFIQILDYVFLNKDSDAQSALTANLLTLLPGTIGVLMKKRYMIVYSLDINYFSLTEMYNISNEVSKVDDDSLV